MSTVLPQNRTGHRQEHRALPPHSSTQASLAVSHLEQRSASESCALSAKALFRNARVSCCCCCSAQCALSAGAAGLRSMGAAVPCSHVSGHRCPPRAEPARRAWPARLRFEERAAPASADALLSASRRRAGAAPRPRQRRRRPPTASRSAARARMAPARALRITARPPRRRRRRRSCRAAACSTRAARSCSRT